MLLQNKACIVVEETGTLWLKGNDIFLNGQHAVIILKGNLKTEEEVDFTFSGAGFLQVHDTHTLDMGEGSNFVLQRPPTSNPERFIHLRSNAVLNIEDRDLILENGKVIYKDNTQLIAKNGRVLLDNVILEGETVTETLLNGIGLKGESNATFNVSNSRIRDLGVGIEYSGQSTAFITNNRIRRCSTGVFIHDANKTHLTDCTFSENYMDAVKLVSSNYVNSRNNNLTGTSNADGFDLSEAGFTYINNCRVSGFKRGIFAHHSNVLLGDGSEIFNNNIGVLYYENQTAEYLLAVGKCQCAHIYKNTIGVQGNNIVLEIDAEENQAACNSPNSFPNSFHDNQVVFDICYTDPNFPINTPILMKRNNWGGVPLSSLNYSITKSNCNAPMQVNFNNWSVDQPAPPNCVPTGQPYDPSDPFDLVPVLCNVSIAGNAHHIHTESKIGFQHFRTEDFKFARQKFKPISSLNPFYYNSVKCVHKIAVAKCMVKCLDKILEKQAKLHSEDFPSDYQSDQEVKGKSVTKSISINPNPVKDILNIKTNSEDKYTIRCYNLLGNLIFSKSLNGTARINVQNWENGLYIMDVLDEQGNRILTERIVVQ